jgi:putative CocE/NonD family hydrolase
MNEIQENVVHVHDDTLPMCTEFMVPMRDGVHLATDVYLPAGYSEGIDAPLPTILERTPYGKREVSRSEINQGTPAARRSTIAAYFVARGFAVVFQDCRGRYASEGEFTKYLSEGADGYDTFAWLTKQAWSTGRIGTMGLSYAAHTQMAAACLNPPGLACMVMDSGGFANSYQCGIRQGGAFELKQATWAVNQAIGSRTVQSDPLLKAALEQQDLKQWFARMPWRPGQSPLRHVPEYERYLFDQWTHEAFDGFWQQSGIYAEGFYQTMARVPTVLMSSWYDAYVRSTVDNFSAMSRLDPVNAPTYLIMGSWLHGDRNVPYSGDVDFGPAAMIEGQIAEDWLAFRAAWFTRWLKPEAATEEASAPRVPEDAVAKIFVMGGGSGTRNAEGRMMHGGAWIQASDWPLPETRATPFFLRPDGLLAERMPMSEDPTVGEKITYAFDPADPVPTAGGALTSGAPVFHGGAFDQREDTRFFGSRSPGMPLSARGDVLVFETPPLAEDMAVVGPIVVKLWISSDAPDTDFTAKLIDMYPPNVDYPQGFAMNLTDGIFRCRFHASWEHPEMLQEGRIYEIEIEPFATANLFKQGHRIRLDISSSNFPRFDINPNSGESPAVARAARIARNTVHFGTESPSHIVLPIVPLSALTPLAPFAR